MYAEASGYEKRWHIPGPASAEDGPSAGVKKEKSPERQDWEIHRSHVVLGLKATLRVPILRAVGVLEGFQRV